ncbi:ThuA domain-containing protein [Actinoplanes sp. NPDC051851]|uniref:ThuA domain-containing protein n=1 Tax=Actinoplanes sp. NPDC051851 TaxID=3154753 RepID=UPI0034324C58
MDLLVFTRTTGYRHDSIPAAVTALSRHFTVTHSEDPSAVTACARFDAVAFVSTTGDVLDPPARSALRAFVENGGGFAGIHSAAGTELTWDWYGTLLGARFAGHPAGVQTATMRVTPGHPSTAHLPPEWTFTDEWYAFTDVRKESLLLVSVDEATYEPGDFTMPAPHPQAWCRQIENGRSWYTSLGHEEAAWSDPAFLTHVVDGIRWTRE